MGKPGTWEILLILLVVVLLFGAKKLPEAARGLGRSLRIFKAETKAMREDDEPDADVVPPAPREITAAGDTPQASPAVRPSSPPHGSETDR